MADTFTELNEYLSTSGAAPDQGVADQILARLRQKYKNTAELTSGYLGLEQELFGLPEQMEAKYPTDPSAAGYVRPQTQRKLLGAREQGVGGQMEGMLNLIKNEAKGTESAWNALMKMATSSVSGGRSLTAGQIEKELEYAKYKYWAERMTDIMNPGKEGLDGAGDINNAVRDLNLIIQEANKPRFDDNGEIVMDSVEPETFADLQDLLDYYTDELWERSATRESEAEPTNIFSKGLSWLIEHLF